jgi:NTE family protein
MAMTKNALVLAGGGVAGIAWETGLLLGIQDENPALVEQFLDQDTTLIGTSAGAAVGAQIASGTPLLELFERQLSEATAELNPGFHLQALVAKMTEAITESSSPEEARRRIGVIARSSVTTPRAARRVVIEARLPSMEWPAQPLLITAVDIDSGELQVFRRGSSASVVDAVEASCAVPGVWPTVEIDGHSYMDGGMRTIGNADLAQGANRVLIVVPSSGTSALGAPITPEELEALGDAKIQVIYSDGDSLAAIGLDPLDPDTRKPAALAGREQGRRCSDELAEFWNTL